MPADEREALSSDLMGLFEKRRFRNLLAYIQDFKEDDPTTWKGLDPKASPMSALFEKFGVDKNTIDVTGHALALHRWVGGGRRVGTGAGGRWRFLVRPVCASGL